MAKLVFVGLTMEQAKALASWYEGQGEQDSYEWLDNNDIPPVMTNCSRKGGYREIDEEKEIVTVYCK